MTRTTIRFDLRPWATGLPVALMQIGLFATPSFADNPTTSDWPCIYRKVPETERCCNMGRTDDHRHQQLAQRRAGAKAVEVLISRRVKQADAETAIKKFADSLPADTRDAKLTELFAAVLLAPNKYRKVVILALSVSTSVEARNAAKQIETEGLTLPPNGNAEDGPASDRRECPARLFRSDPPL